MIPFCLNYSLQTVFERITRCSNMIFLESWYFSILGHQPLVQIKWKKIQIAVHAFKWYWHLFCHSIRTLSSQISLFDGYTFCCCRFQAATSWSAIHATGLVEAVGALYGAGHEWSEPSYPNCIALHSHDEIFFNKTRNKMWNWLQNSSVTMYDRGILFRKYCVCFIASECFGKQIQSL